MLGIVAAPKLNFDELRWLGDVSGFGGLQFLDGQRRGRFGLGGSLRGLLATPIASTIAFSIATDGACSSAPSAACKALTTASLNGSRSGPSRETTALTVGT